MLSGFMFELAMSPMFNSCLVSYPSQQRLADCVNLKVSSTSPLSPQSSEILFCFAQDVQMCWIHLHSYCVYNVSE